MMRFQKIILLLLVFLLCGTILYYNIGVRPFRDFRNFDDKVCNNLVKAGYLVDETNCFSTDNWSHAVNPLFPIGEVDIYYVTAGMEGFKQTEKSTYSDKNCENAITIWYQTVGGLRMTGYVEFIFCDELLIQNVIHN